MGARRCNAHINKDIFPSLAHFSETETLKLLIKKQLRTRVLVSDSDTVDRLREKLDLAYKIVGCSRKMVHFVTK